MAKPKVTISDTIIYTQNDDYMLNNKIGNKIYQMRIWLERSDSLTTEIDILEQDIRGLNKERVDTGVKIGELLGIEPTQINYEQLRKVIGM